MITWLLITYSLPSEPSARRVYIWRKLKRLGAISIFDAVWVLPETPHTHEQFQWLTAEILEMGGEAMFWRAQNVVSVEEDPLTARFSDQIENAYADLLARLEQPDPDLPAIAQSYQQLKQRDYFHSPTGRLVYERLLAARGEKL